ncbi:Protein TAPT1 [Blattella germanica]|nr:Protein TAPT1 [Blattella germanica]
MVLFAEVLVDWIKHAFITRFNELPVDVYRDYTISLAYDMAQTRQKHAFSDHSDLVARRMGFIPLPLGVVMVRVLCHALHLDGPAAIMLLIISYFCLASFRILNSIVILGKACDLISQHQQEKAAAAASPAWSRATSPVNGRPNNHAPSSVARELAKEMRDSASDSVRITSIPLQRSVTIAVVPMSDDKEKSTQEKPPDCTLGPAAIFSNSAVSINNVCLNPELFIKPEDEVNEEKDMAGISELDDGKTRSVPNIHANVDSEAKDLFTQEISSTFANEEFAKKRAESEPSLPHLVESERTGPSPP